VLCRKIKEISMEQIIQYGSKGHGVQHLQTVLNKSLPHSPPLAIDGHFGQRTEAAVRIYQASAGLAIDGVVGPQTWKALRRPHPHLDMAISAPLPLLDVPWLDIAAKEIGVRAIHGPQHNLRIIEYHATTSLHASNDETAWCSAFVNWCLQQAGIKGTNSAAACSWVTWGKPCSPKPGAITAIHHVGATAIPGSGNHVAFFLQDLGTHLKLLGGNQSNRVRESLYPKTRWQVLSYRWPPA
jgi:uncharacterized protein (TIGR02594 family)